MNDLPTEIHRGGRFEAGGGVVLGISCNDELFNWMKFNLSECSRYPPVASAFGAVWLNHVELIESCRQRAVTSRKSF